MTSHVQSILVVVVRPGKFKLVSMEVTEAKFDNKSKRKRLILTEDDVPGASFQGKNPELFHVCQLKRWLKCRGASTTGNRSELLDR